MPFGVSTIFLQCSCSQNNCTFTLSTKCVKSLSNITWRAEFITSRKSKPVSKKNVHHEKWSCWHHACFPETVFVHHRNVVVHRRSGWIGLPSETMSRQEHSLRSSTCAETVLAARCRKRRLFGFLSFCSLWIMFLCWLRAKIEKKLHRRRYRTFLGGIQKKLDYNSKR